MVYRNPIPDNLLEDKMDFTKKIIVFMLLVFTGLVYSDTNRLGIALIHGTKDHRDDADGGYWKKEFIQTLSQGLSQPDNIRVVNCDFNQNFWHEDATGCVASQLQQFIQEKNLSKLLVITHSHGGNMLRWIISNPSYDPRFSLVHSYIAEVIAIAPSSAGTPLADAIEDGNVFETSLGWLLGYNSDSVKQQQENAMQIANDQVLLGTSNRPDLGVPFKTIIGTDVWASPLTNNSYCNGYMLNASLKVTKIYLDQCADGFLNCTSQANAGEVWFTDTQKTENQLPLSHNQSRHSCFGLDSILVDEIRRLEALA